MNAVLATLGTKLTERVATRLTGPGLLYIALCVCAVHTGHAHALDPHRLRDALEAWGGADALGTAVQIALLLAAATVAGQAASFVGTAVVGRVWTAEAAPRWWIERRRRAWDREHAHRKPKPPTRYRPERLTPVGDRFRLVAERVDAQYGLSVPLAWPRLMTLAETDTRDLLTAAYERYRAAETLTAWGLLVLFWAAWWWPALPIAAAGLAAGYARSRSSGETLAALIESVVDTHQARLAESVGVALPEGRLTDAEGPQINNILNKRA